MIYLWLILLILLNVVWLSLVFFALPGNWLMIATTAIFAWLGPGEEIFSIYTFVAIALLALLGEVMEFFAGAGGAKKAGAGIRGATGAICGAIIGALLGTIFIPILVFGTLVGSCFGAGLGAWIAELAGGRRMRHSVHSGVGAGVGQFLGVSAKFAIGIVIWLIVSIAAFIG